MADKIGTYDTHSEYGLDLDSLINIMADKGVGKIYIKKLAPNDNSKNQPYFGFHLTDLPFIPTGPMEASQSTSNKKKDKARQIKYKTSLKLEWVDSQANTYPAPNAKLIYYPQYPEVRFSGFLQGSKVNLSRWMAPEKQGRADGRWLLLGVNEGSETIYAYLATPESVLAKELENTSLTKRTSLFSEINIGQRDSVVDTKAALLQKLLEIHELGWVPGCKLNKDMIKQPYKAANGGGYTLEALLGITPNGIAEPDYLGWEVKQFGVKSFPTKGASPTTLMTPEPNGGVYKIDGIIEFMKRFGYPDKSGKPDRLNFGGIHSAGRECAATKLTLAIDGFDGEHGKLTKADGAIVLADSSGTVAASWGFEKIMDHWKRKHSQAVYIPCMMKPSDTGGRSYHYGNNIELGTGTDFEIFLSAMLGGFVYYDPGIKLEHASTEKPKSKRRSQFRVKHNSLSRLYKRFEFVDVTA